MVEQASAVKMHNTIVQEIFGVEKFLDARLCPKIKCVKNFSAVY